MKLLGKHRTLLACLACAMAILYAGCNGSQAYDTGNSRNTGRAGSSSGKEYGSLRLIEAGELTGDTETFVTDSESILSVRLDEDKTLYLDADTCVDYVREDHQLRLNVSEGRVLLDVREKLGPEETLTVGTASMDVDIRGTIVYVSDQPVTGGNRTSVLGVLEGNAEVSYADAGGVLANVSAGDKAVLRYEEEQAGQGNTAFSVAEITQADTEGFIAEVIENDPALSERIHIDYPGIAEESFPADGDWTYNGKVTLIAQSAAKLYDGTPLSRPHDVLVYGLPEKFTIRASASGSQTDAGSSSNSITQYSILNEKGEDVTSHFTNIETVAGTLVVDPVPVRVWTGSASKVYDGTPLVCPEAGIRTVDRDSSPAGPEWQNSAWETGNVFGGQELYGVAGTTTVRGTDPLTGKSQEYILKAGQKLTVVLSGNEDGRIFTAEDIKEEEIPEELLRIYADNPDMLAQICEETGWDPEKIKGLIKKLPAVSEKQDPDLLHDSVNVRISVDTAITDYDGMALGSREVEFTTVYLDPTINVAATGSRTEVGESFNTYDIDWGSANPDNYVLSEDLGILRVTAPEKPTDPDPQDPIPPDEPDDPDDKPSQPTTYTVTITAGSGEKVYDGNALTVSTYTVSGLPKGYQCTAVCSGSQTDAGESTNKITEYKILDPKGEDVTKQFKAVKKAGKLTVKPLEMTVKWSADQIFRYDSWEYNAGPGTAVLTYKNGEHAGETITVVNQGDEEPEQEEGYEDVYETAYLFSLFTGDGVTAYISGSGTAAGTYPVNIRAKVTSGTEANYSISCDKAEFKIEPLNLIVKTNSDEKTYDGTPLTGNVTVYITVASTGELVQVSNDGVVTLGNDTITFTATGTRTEPGSAVNTYAVSWDDESKAGNYTFTEELGTLTVKESSAGDNTDFRGILIDSNRGMISFPALNNARYTYHCLLDELMDLIRTLSSANPEMNASEFQNLVCNQLNARGWI